MPIGTWAPPTPEYLTAPGFATYAPTRAYAYSPTGGDWSGTYPSYGGGGGGLTSGDFGGGTDTSTLGNALSALSLLGGANSLSSFLTGKSLMEHAGIPNPFSNFLGGGEGMSFTDMLPNEVFGGLKDALGIYPSQGGLLTPGGGTALLTDAQGAAMADALGGTQGYFNTASPSVNPAFALGPPPGASAPLTPIDVMPLGDPSPGMNVANAYAEAQAQLAAQPGMPTAGPYGPVTTPSGSQIPASWNEMMNNRLMTQDAIVDALHSGGPNPLNTVSNLYTAPPAGYEFGMPADWFQHALPGGIEGTVGVGPSGYLTPDALAGVSNLGAPPSSLLTGAAPAVGATAPGFVGSSYLGAGHLTGGALGGPGAATGLNAGIMAPLALAMYGMKRMAPDHTADPRMANQLENHFQRALQGPKQEALELDNLKQQVFANPASIQVMKLAAEGGVPGATHTSGGRDIVGWPEPVADKFFELLPELEQVAIESNQANYGGEYNIGDFGLSGKPPNPYGENKKEPELNFDPDTATWQPKRRPAPEGFQDHP